MGCLMDGQYLKNSNSPLVISTPDSMTSFTWRSNSCWICFNLNGNRQSYAWRPAPISFRDLLPTFKTRRYDQCQKSTELYINIFTLEAFGAIGVRLECFAGSCEPNHPQEARWQLEDPVAVSSTILDGSLSKYMTFRYFMCDLIPELTQGQIAKLSVQLCQWGIHQAKDRNPNISYCFFIYTKTNLIPQKCGNLLVQCAFIFCGSEPCKPFNHFWSN
jgi:hypothetical protein